MALNTYKQIIGYSNLFADTVGTLTVSHEDATRVGTNAIDYTTSNSWLPNTTSDITLKMDLGSGNDQAADYFAVQGHNLPDNGSTIALEYSADDVSYTAVATTTPNTNDVIFMTFTSVSARYWRAKITGANTATYLTNIFAGARLDLPAGARIGFAMPRYQRQDVIQTSVTERGQFVGASQRAEDIGFTITGSFLSKSFVTSNYEDFIDHAFTKPFFYQWDDTNHSTGHAVYCWLRSGSRPRLTSTHNQLYEISLDVNARKT